MSAGTTSGSHLDNAIRQITGTEGQWDQQEIQAEYEHIRSQLPSCAATASRSSTCCSDYEWLVT